MKHPHIVCRVFLLAIIFALCGCGPVSGSPGSTDPSLQSFDGLEGSIDIAGGTAHIPVMTEAAKRIMTAHPEIRITITGGGSGVGVQKVGEGLVQIGNTGRGLSDAEVARYGLVSFPFAVDGVAAVVHPSNPLRDFSKKVLQDLFAGRITNWQEVGGPDLGVNLYVRDEASGTRKVFWSKALDAGPVAEGASVVASNGAMKAAVSRDPGALGYLSIGHVDDTVASASLDGVAASQENARRGSYPVVRQLFMNTKGEPRGLTAAVIEYLRGPTCADIISEKRFIPLGP